VNPKANLFALLILFNPLYLGRGWAVAMENDQLIANLHVHGIFHLNRDADPAKGLVKDRGTLSFIPNDHPHFGLV